MLSLSRNAFRTLGVVTAALPSLSFAIIATTSTTTVAPADTSLADLSAGYFIGKDASGSPDFGTVGSGVAISPYAVLTAKHVGPSAVGIGNSYVVSQYNASGTVAATTSYGISKVVDDPNADLRIVFLQSPLASFATLATSYATGDTIRMVGSGQSGLLDASGQHYDVTTGQGVRMSGANTIDGEQDFGGGIGPAFYSFLKAPGEATVVNGDSGGGWFNAAGQLVGLSDFNFNETPTDNSGGTKYPNYGFKIPAGGSYRYSDYFPNAAGTPDDYTLNAGDYYYGSGAIDLTNSDVRSFIVTTLAANPVPEPSALTALGLGALAVLRRRRR